MSATTLKGPQRGPTMRRIITAIITLVASTVLLAGCGDENDPAKSPRTTTPPTTATTTPTVTPEDHAEAAAWQAYLKYAKVREDLSRSPDIQKANRLAVQVAVPPESAYLVVGITQYVERGQRLTGRKAISTKTGANVRSLREVVFDVCLDNTAIDVVDKTGKSVVLPDHPKKVAVTITLKQVKGTWYVAKKDGGTEAC